MKKKKSPIGFIIILLVVVTGAVFLVRHFHIKNFQVIRQNVLYSSGQPRGMDYPRLLYKYHIATIVNVRLISEHRSHNWYNEEITWAGSNGVKYIEMPIERGHYLPDEKTQDQFLAIMADKTNLPVLLHGSADDKRVALLVAVWLRKNQEYNLEQTMKVFRTIIDDREPIPDEIKFIENLTK